jgi:pyruvate/2-oxoglutarate/acetoin dehydrogenase E1 component
MKETYYRQKLEEAMDLLGKDPRTIFIGQTVAYPGSRFTYGTLGRVPKEKRMELPIMEEAQMGMSIGLALEGYVPVSIYPRVDFVLLAMNQLVNHLDKMEEMSQGQANPHVIIRATIGSTKPLYPGPQHSKDQTSVLEKSLENVYVKRLDSAEEIVPEYRAALERGGPSLLIDDGNLHFDL